MSAPQIKGWCPGAHRPMLAADGLVVRIRPRLARLEAAQALGLCDLARRYGHGYLDLTNRANLQIRGVAEGDHAALLHSLGDLGLLDADPALEERRNILVSPFWQEGDIVRRLTLALLARLSDLPDLPAKVGFAIDCGAGPVLTADSADLRIERAASGLILRADGAAAGRAVSEDSAIPALIEMAHWLADHITPDHRRMARVVAAAPLPPEWCDTPLLPPAQRPQIGVQANGAMIGAAFGHVDAAALTRVIRAQGLAAIRVTPWRTLFLEGGAPPDEPAFVTDPDDPLMRVDACPGAPYCPSATVPTRALARRLAPHVTGTLHVSGCSKGCARKRAADVTLIGREGRFDMLRQGCVENTPEQYGLSPDDILAEVSALK
ncbi:cobalamin biosynthesis protein CobG [Roseovarius sp. M141]|uniref:cobalamin biosynthesis protein CobG n=1 Tax=Roseovarius sp. M141 TaxID=2583806 RepID=UPI0020CEBDD1|nr:cobalamin biosynthesis protein CobG [Roseovarius sp. M141]MCQ0091693.1 cobalamin biosynthesis protein CobG [Roseovarius sp. M141]